MKEKKRREKKDEEKKYKIKKLKTIFSIRKLFLKSEISVSA